MVGGTIMGYLGGLHYWWPKITGRLYTELLAKLSAAIIFVGFNLTFFPQFILGYLGHAAALSRLSAGVPGAERAVVGGRVDPRRRLPDADDLLDVVAALRPASPARTRGARSAWSGRRHRRRRRRTSRETPVVTWEAYDYPGAGGGPRCLTARVVQHDATHHPALAHHFDSLEQQSEATTLGMWVFLVTEILFFGGLFAGLHRSIARWYPEAFAAASHELIVWAGTLNTVGPDHQQPDDGAGGARGADGRAPAADAASWSSR